jgi:hypothetical protein
MNSEAERTTLEEPESTGLVSEGVEQWGVEKWDVAQVVSFFERHNFPTAGVVQGQVDGATLLRLYDGPDAKEIFTAPAAEGEGLGFTKILFIGRFKKEMASLTGARVTPSTAKGRQHQAQRQAAAKRHVAGREARPDGAAVVGHLPSIAEADFGLMRACLGRM